MSTAEDNKQVVRDYFQRGMAGDPNLGELFTDESTWWVPASSPLGGTHRGPAAILAMLERAFALYDVSTMKIELPLIFAEGKDVCVLFHLESKTTRGTHHVCDYLAHFEVKDGKILSVREFFDTHRVREVVFGLGG